MSLRRDRLLQRLYGRLQARRSGCWVRKICGLAKVPMVSAHGLRGTHSTLATTAGATAHFVVSAMGHTSFDVTRKHYLAPGAEENARAKRTFEVLQGGKSVNDTVQSFIDARSGSQSTS
jgi:integrase